jgi:hypothetical protein
MRRVCVVVILTIAGLIPLLRYHPSPPPRPAPRCTPPHHHRPALRHRRPALPRPRHRRPALPPPAVSIPQITDPVARALVACLGIAPLIHDG